MSYSSRLLMTLYLIGQEVIDSYTPNKTDLHPQSVSPFGESQGRQLHSRPSIKIDQSDDPPAVSQSHHLAGSWLQDIPSLSPIEELGPPNALPARASGSVFPDQIPCAVHHTFEASRGVQKSTAEYSSVRINDSNAYNVMERNSYNHVNSQRDPTHSLRPLSFTYGNCTIASDEEFFKQGIPLNSQAELEEIFKEILKYWQVYNSPDLRLHIYRNYIVNSLRVQTDDSDASLTDVKKNELNACMLRTLDNRKYISKPDLAVLTSSATIRELIDKDTKLSLSDDEKETFVQNVTRWAPTLLAVCILAGLRMRCLKTLIEAGRHDGDIPLTKDHICHPNRCSADFDHLLEKQWSFIAAKFDEEGRHHTFSPAEVIPVHYFPVKDANFDEAPKKGLSSFPHGEINDINKKDLSRCGSGAYSSVYCVKIHPSQHALALVSFSFLTTACYRF